MSSCESHIDQKTTSLTHVRCEKCGKYREMTASEKEKVAKRKPKEG